MISVVIPLYNKEKQIVITLQTVLKQTFQNFEVIVVNDGSTDNSVAEVEKINDSRIRIINQVNKGVSAARNRGIEEAKYDLIAFLDADDEWKPEYLETQYHLFVKYPNCNVFATNYEFRDSMGNITKTIINKLPFNGEDGILTNYFEVASYSHPPICSISIMVKKNAIYDINCFPVGIKSGEDLLTWARLAVKYKIAFSRKSLSIYDVQIDGVNSVPKRLPPDNDIVGYELKQLYKIYKTKGLRLYISHWHKMRTSIYMRLNMKSKCIKEAVKALRYNCLNYKVLIYVFLVLLPVVFRNNILKRL